jgi:hypothetical protein
MEKIANRNYITKRISKCQAIFACPKSWVEQVVDRFTAETRL